MTILALILLTDYLFILGATLLSLSLLPLFRR